MRYLLPSLVIVTFGLAFLSFGQSATKNNATGKWMPGAGGTNVVGTWKIHPSSFTIRERISPNALPRPQFPTNYNSFILVLRKDGSFVTTNVPANLLFDWPATTNRSGKWLVTKASVPLLLTDSTNTYSELTLSFIKPHSSELTLPIDLYRKDPSSPYKPAIAFGPYQDESKTYEYSFLIVKED